MEVLQWVRTHQPVSVRHVWTHFQHLDGRARTTVLTTMENLRKKGWLTRRKVGRGWVYVTPEPGQRQEQGLLAEFIRTAFGGQHSALVQYLADPDLELSDADLAELKALVDRLEAE